MAKVLSKYSQAKNLVVEYTNQQEYNEALIDQQQALVPADYNSPFNFQDWYKRNTGIIAGEEYKQYNEYLKNWYLNRYTASNLTVNIKDQYIAFLKQLKLVVKDEDIDSWLKDVNFDNDLELEDAIPFFARKLKEIAIYLVNKRSALKLAKLKYNMSGAQNAIGRLFYEYLLKAFSKRDYVLNVPEQSAWNVFPELSSINNGFQIVVQELYDDKQYFDKSPQIPISSYFLTDYNSLSTYYIDLLGFNENDFDWLFGTGIAPLCAENSLFWMLSTYLQDYNVTTIANLPLSTITYNKTVCLPELQILLNQKYLGGDQYYISGGYYQLKTQIFDYPLKAGNNWFYWPSGEYYNETSDSTFDVIALSSTTLVNNGAKAGDTYKSADKIFIDIDGSISGAWLKNDVVDTQVVDMCANFITNEHLIFKFPFPGFGISGEGLDWTGKQLSNLESNYYLEPDVQQIINNAYWNDMSSISSIQAISIHNTNLIDSGAYPAQYYDQADTILIRDTENEDNVHDTEPNTLYDSEENKAWLYKFLKTDIPVKTNKNYIYWPLLRYETSDNLLLTIPSSQCIGISLSTMNINNDLIGARAGYGLFDSDIIYKLDSKNGYAIECAFLSAQDLATIVPGVTGKIQPSFTLKCKPGTYETFIWQDQTKLITTTSIKQKSHQIGCPYVNATHDSIYQMKGQTIDELNMSETGIGNYKNCDCKAILYSPLGHPGSKWDDYDRMADIIFVDNQFPDIPDFTTWRGVDGQMYNQSSDFAWYRLTGTNIEKDVGWGDGVWTTGAGTTTFSLSHGVRYKYLRANLRRTPEELLDGAVPVLIIKETHNSTLSSTWMKAVLNEDGTWEKTLTASDMILNAGDFILYDHMDSNWYCITSTGSYGPTYQYLPSALNAVSSQWCNYTWITTGYTIDLKWPTKFYADGPSEIAQSLTSVSWEVITPTQTLSALGMSPYAAFSIYADTIGSYQPSVTGYNMYGKSIFTNIPNISCANKELTIAASGEYKINTIYNDRINFSINIPLSGWSYITNTFDSSSVGARPFWAKANNDASETTKYKGIDYWGGGIRSNVVDDYTFITQPDIADISLNTNQYVDYYHRGDGFTWIEPIDFIINSRQAIWKKLYIDTDVVSPLSSYLYNINQELVVSATDADSEIKFYQPTNTNMIINYWAENAFTWSQELTDSTIGVPPTGGVWVPAISGILNEAIVPYANLTNRHYPTIASVPYVESLFKSEDTGWCNTPRMLGASVYLGKNYTNIINTDKILSENKGLSGIFRDPDYFITDRGLSDQTQVAPLSTISIDASWMKSHITEGYKSGAIANAKEYQEFIPYQSRFETLKQNYNGLRSQTDEYDPWIGDFDTTWVDAIRWPANTRGEYNIDEWYHDANQITDKLLYQWQTDIFGNQYGLYKDSTIESIYNRNQAFGTLYTRMQDNKVLPASGTLSGVFINFNLISPLISDDLENNGIKNFNIFYDTIMIVLSSYILFEKLSFDYDTNIIDAIADNVRYINLYPANNGHFGGTWLFDENKQLVVCTVLSADGFCYPNLYKLDLDTNKLTTFINSSANANVTQTSSLQLTSIEDPIFTYNNITKDFNISYIGSSPLYRDMVLSTINIKNVGNAGELTKVTCITPLL